MEFIFWIKHPRKLLHRLRYWMWEKQNPDKPWMCSGTIAFCKAHLTRQMKALEFGSGRSTAWFSSLVGTLTSIEHERKWYDHVKQQLTANGPATVDYRLVALNHDQAEPERETYEPAPDYVSAIDDFPDNSLDLVIVDGHYRTHCVRHAIRKIVPGGYLLVDDINLWTSPESLPIPTTWRIADDSTNGVKRCIIWQAGNPLEDHASTT